MPLNYPAMKAFVAVAALSVPHAVGFDAGAPVPAQSSAPPSASALGPQWSPPPPSSILDDPLLSGGTATTPILPLMPLPGQPGTRVYITRDLGTGQTYHRSVPTIPGPSMTKIPTTYYLDKLVIMPDGSMQVSGPKLVTVPDGSMQTTGPDKTFKWKPLEATPIQLTSATAADAKPGK